MLHPLLVRHRTKGLRTALVFSSKDPSLEQIPYVVPVAEREPFPGGWIVADVWAASLVPVITAPICEACAMGQLCAFGRRQEPMLVAMGYAAPGGDNLARLAERIPVYGGTIAMGVRAFSRIDRAVSAAASLAAKMFPAPGMRPRHAPLPPPPSLAPELQHHARVLGLVWPFGLPEVHRAFLARANRAHPDGGGTAQKIQAVVEARNAFVRAWGPKQAQAAGARR